MDPVVSFINSLRPAASSIEAVTIINDFRTNICNSWYLSLMPDSRKTLCSFTWTELNRLWKGGSAQLRIAISKFVSRLLIRLAPFQRNDLLEGIINGIRTTTDESVLILTSLCYISSYFPDRVINKVLEDLPILHLFGTDDSSSLEMILGVLSKYSTSFLETLVEYLVNLSIKHPSNRHIPKAIAIASNANKSIADNMMINTWPLWLIAAVFTEKLPKISSEISNKIFNEAERQISAYDATPTDSESAIVVLKSLWLSGYVSDEVIATIITPDILSRTRALEELLDLPVPYSTVSTLFEYVDNQEMYTITKCTSNDDINHLEYASSLDTISPVLSSGSGIVMTDSSPMSAQIHQSDSQSSLVHTKPVNDTQRKRVVEFGIVKNQTPGISPSPAKYIVSPRRSPRLTEAKEKITPLFQCRPSHVKALLKYLASHKESTDIAVHLLQTFLHPSSEHFASALSALGKGSSVIPSDIFFKLVAQALSSPTKDGGSWIQKLWQLHFLTTLPPIDLPKYVLKRAFSLIESSATSHSERLRTASLNTTNYLISFLPTEATKFFADALIRRSDPFDKISFCGRLKLLSKVMNTSISSSFSHMTLLLGELIDIDTTPMFINDSLELLSKLPISGANLFSKYAEKSLTNALEAFISGEGDDADVIAGEQSSLIPATAAANLLAQGDTDVDPALVESALCLFPEQMLKIQRKRVDAGKVTDASGFISRALKSASNRNSIFALGRLVATCIEKKVSVGDTRQICDMLIEQLQKEGSASLTDAEAARCVIEANNIPISSSLISKAVNRGERHLLPSPDKEENYVIDFSGSDDEINNTIEQPFDNQQSDSDGSTEEHVNEESLIQSLSPYIFENITIPSNLLKPALIKSYSRFSTVKAKQHTLEELLSVSINSKCCEAVEAVLELSSKSSDPIDLTPYLRCEYLSTNNAIPFVLKHFNKRGSFTALTQEEKLYIKQNCSSHYVRFLLKTKTRIRIAMSLFSIDPHHFLMGFADEKSLTTTSLEHICMYIQHAQSDSSAVGFAISMVTRFMKSRRKLVMSLRLLAIALYKHHSPEAVDALAEIIKTTTLDIALREICIIIKVLSRKTITVGLARALNERISFNTWMGVSLRIIGQQLEPDQLTEILDSKMASIQLQPYMHYSRSNDISQQTVTVLLSATLRKNAVIQHFLYNFIAELLSEKQPRNIITFATSFVFRNFEITHESASLGLTATLCKHLVSFMRTFAPEVREIYDLCCYFMDSPILPSNTCELLGICSRKLGDPELALRVLKQHLKKYRSYNSNVITEYASLFALRSSTRVRDAIDVVPLTASFYSIFYSIISIEKKDPSIRHELLKEKFTTPHDEAILWLDDPEKKKFSVFLALREDRIEDEAQKKDLPFSSPSYACSREIVE